jgi:hypothetical protein
MAVTSRLAPARYFSNQENAGKHPLTPARAFREVSMSKLTYAIAIMIGIMMFTIGALAGHPASKPWKSTTGSYAEQAMPFPLIVKAWERGHQTGDQPF